MVEANTLLSWRVGRPLQVESSFQGKTAKNPSRLRFAALTATSAVQWLTGFDISSGMSSSVHLRSIDCRINTHGFAAAIANASTEAGGSQAAKHQEGDTQGVDLLALGEASFHL